jgi:hypothetical protein
MRTFLFSLILLCSVKFYSQDTIQKNFFSDFRPGGVIGVILQDRTYLTAGGLYLLPYDEMNKQTVSFGFCADISINTSDVVVGPRFFADFSKKHIGARINFSEYYQKNLSEFRLTPEIFITLFGNVNLSYGYAFCFPERNIVDAGFNRVSLIFNFANQK